MTISAADDRARGAGVSERRPITVLFADIAGSTSIAERLDPEDWTTLVGEAFQRMNRTIERYGGTIARLMQAAARPGSVLITAATHRFVSGLVEAIDVGQLELKGKSATVRAYEITSLKEGAVHSRGLAGVSSPMVGRDSQLRQLEQL